MAGTEAPRHIREAVVRYDRCIRYEHVGPTWDADGNVFCAQRGYGSRGNLFRGGIVNIASGYGEELYDEFWGQASTLFAHGPSGLAWFAGDTRIKGYDTTAIGKEVNSKGQVPKYCFSRTRGTDHRSRSARLVSSKARDNPNCNGTQD